MAELIPTFASIAALIFLAFALFSRNRLAQSQAVLADVSSRLEAVSKQSKQLEQQLRNAQENADKYRQQSAQADKQLEDTKQKLSDRTVEWNKLKAEREDVQNRYALQREHLEEQVQVLMQQLGDAVKEKKSVQDENGKLQKDGDEKARQAIEVVRQQLRESQLQTQQARREKQQLESQLSKAKQEAPPSVKPEELQRYKQKVARLEQLYGSMRGLRELAEERNKNWETALRYFAGHLLQQPLDADLQNQSIGRLVGEALEKIGASLVIETKAEAAAAEAAAVAAAADHSPIPVAARAPEAVTQTMSLWRNNFEEPLFPADAWGATESQAQPGPTRTHAEGLLGKGPGIFDWCSRMFFDPHNVGACLRSAEAFGILCCDQVNLYQKFGKISTVSRGADQWLEVRRFTDLELYTKGLREKGFKWLQPILQAPLCRLMELPLDEPLAIVFGNEREGLHQAWHEHVDYRFTIPMYGMVESLNVSVSAALTLHSLSQRCRTELAPEKFLLPEAAQRRLLDQWICRHSHNPEDELARMREQSSG